MNKNILISLLTAGALIASSAGAAVVPEELVVTLDPIAPLAYEPTQFPVIYNVTGSLDYGFDVAIGSSVTLYINDVFESSQAIDDNTFGIFNYSVPWLIAGPETYTVKVVAVNGFSEGVAETTVTVSQTEPTPASSAGCKAAPAIANELLKAKGVKPGVEDRKNFVSQIAHDMEPQTSFQGVSACDITSYEAVINSYLDDVLAAY